MNSNSNRHDGYTTHHSHHHHHHKEHTPDASEIFKNNSLLSIKRRKIIGKYLFIVLFLFAIAVIGACVLATFM